MSKAENVDDLLGGDAAATPAKVPAKKAAAKAPSKPAKEPKEAKADKAPAKVSKPAAKAPAKKAAAKEESVKRERAPIAFEEGERDKLYAKIGKTLGKVDKKKGINSRELAEKLGTETRKLRVCLYTMQGRGEVKLKAGESKVSGMMVHPV
jgi:hypothetical protein